MNSVLEGISRQIWSLPPTFPKAGLHALLEDLGLNIPSVWENYCGPAIHSWTQILNDEGALGTTTRASFHLALAKFRHWPLELAFFSHRGRLPLCPSVMARNMATFLIADLHLVGGPEIWSGNQTSIFISSRLLIHLDEDSCPLEIQPFPRANLLLRKLALLWEHGVRNWVRILYRGPDGRLYFLEEREIAAIGKPLPVIPSS